MGKYGKKNHVSLNPLDYNIMLLGQSKVGKSSVIKEFCEKLAGNDGYLFLECGSERGADAIEGINYVNVPVWYGGNLSDEELERMEQENEACMQDIIDDIIENKTTDYPDLKVVVDDTYDQLITIAEQESIRLWNKSCRESGHSEKCSDSINAAWGGFGKGEKKAMEIMNNMIMSLNKVGVRVIHIGHVKTKEITDVVSGETYQTLTSDQQQNYFNFIKKDMHIVGLAYIDREIIKEKTGKKDTKGKDVIVNKVAGEARKIKFRDDNYAVDSGSRFADIVPEIPLDADAMIKAIKDAILSEQKKSGMSLEDSKKEQIEKERKIQKQIEKNEQAGKERKEIEKIKDSIVNFCTAHKNDIDMIKPILVKCKELGYNNPKEIDNIKDALEVQRLTALTAE